MKYKWENILKKFLNTTKLQLPQNLDLIKFFRQALITITIDISEGATKM
jgi:hypothetical protein